MTEEQIKRHNDRIDALKGEPFTLPDFNLSNHDLDIQIYYRFSLYYIDYDRENRIRIDLQLWSDALKRNELLNRNNLKEYLEALIKDRHTRPAFNINTKVKTFA